MPDTPLQRMRDATARAQEQQRIAREVAAELAAQAPAPAPAPAPDQGQS